MWLEFKEATQEKECMDGTDLSTTFLRQNFKELAFINRHLGGHQANISFLAQKLKKLPIQQSVSVLEVGCGGSDNLGALQRFFEQKGLSFKGTGVDLLDKAIEVSRENYPEMDFYHQDFWDFKAPQKYDFVMANLFFHHIPHDVIPKFIHRMLEMSRYGVLINDLHRHYLAYSSIKLLTKLFSKCPYVVNDAPLSVRRSFVKKDWEKLLQHPLLKHQAFEIEWKWAFRYVVFVEK